MAKKSEFFMCYTFDRVQGGHRRSKGYTASAKKQKKGPVKFAFAYEGFIDFKDYDDFSADLCAAFENQSIVKITPGNPETHEVAERVRSTCGECDSVTACDHAESLEMAWKVNWILQGVLRCPYCGRAILPMRDIPEVELKVHDVRMAGHPARWVISKTRQWYCENCERSISQARIPGIQAVAGGELTLRLLRSIFELNIDGVPRGFIAEGYDLNRDYVGELCRKYKARTQQEYSARRDEVLADMSAGGFYDEPVLLNGEKYRAVFSKEKDKFYTVLRESDILTALQGFTLEAPEQVVKKSQRETTGLYTYSVVAPMRRQLVTGLFETMQAAQVECRQKEPDAIPGLPEEIGYCLKMAVEDDDVDLEELRAFLSDKETFRAVWSTEMRQGKQTYLYRTWEKAKKVVNFLERVLGDGMDAWRMETERENKTVRMKRFWEFERSIREGVLDQPRLPVTEAMERAFEGSEYSVTERFQRLQFYNELSVLCRQEDGTWEMPSMDEEDGMPQLTQSGIGNGIPVACLEHLLKSGLLEKEPGRINCFRDRQKQLDGCCTLDCPFMK